MNKVISERISAMNKTKHSNRMIGADEECSSPDLDGAGKKEMTDGIRASRPVSKVENYWQRDHQVQDT